jgi:hypothetical protein
MKNVFLATVAALGLTATAAAADELAVLGGIEYAWEAETTEVTAGVEYAPAFIGGLTITPMITMNDVGSDFDFASAELTVAYDVAKGVNVYATVESDDDFNYAETTVGLAFRF